jgi:hypothetical protein
LKRRIKLGILSPLSFHWSHDLLNWFLEKPEEDLKPLRAMFADRFPDRNSD